MTLNIKTDVGDRLARELARFTGETLTDSITVALRQRPERECAARAGDRDLPVRIKRFSEQVCAGFDTRPVSRSEWEWASVDEV